MLYQLASMLGLVMAVALVFAVAVTSAFVGTLRRSRRAPATPAASWPRASVILCLRGVDPFLRRCLDGLLAQEYPDYEVQIVVDSGEDPSFELVRSMVESARVPVRVQLLEEKLSTCSLKCSSLVQALGRLDSTTGIVALIDADTIPHRTWLQDLVRPIVTSSTVGAATGNRWYVPGRGWGTTTRYLWNTCAVPLMYYSVIPWAGSLAISRKAVDRLDLRSKLRFALCEDTMLTGLLSTIGMEVRFVTSCLMLNQEEVPLDGCTDWIGRQDLVAMLYHRWWLVANGTGVYLAGIPLAGILLALLSLALGKTALGTLVFTACLLYELILVGNVFALEWGVRSVLSDHHRPGWRPDPASVTRIFLGTPLAQAASILAFFRNFFRREVSWRGVRYRIEGPFKIRLLEYVPFESRLAPELESL